MVGENRLTIIMNLSFEQMGDSVIDLEYKFSYKLRWYHEQFVLMDELLFFGGFMLDEFLVFLLSFVFVFILYRLFIVPSAKKKYKDKNKGREPIEVTYLKNHYHLNMKKISYKKLLMIISIVSSFDISLIVSIIMLFNNFILEIVIGFLSTLVIIYISYYFVYLFFKKKGLICNE